MQQPELKVYEVPTGKLIPYANNAKIHGALQVEQIASSIQEFGFNDPIGVWENKSGEIEIVEGHGRVLAAEKLGIDTVPVIYLNHLSDEQRRAYTHVHNQTTLTSGFDFDVLDAEIEALDFDWESFGFDTDSLTLEGIERGEPEPAGDNGFKYGEVYAIEVVCEGEADQERTYKALTDLGYNCRVVVV